jgi:hypothetical protein
MATRLEVHADEFVELKRATSGFAERFRNHPTLGAGILCAVAIIAVLAFVARL